MDPSKWYSISMKDLSKSKGGPTLRTEHGGFKNALRKAFPEIDFKKWKVVSSS